MWRTKCFAYPSSTVFARGKQFIKVNIHRINTNLLHFCVCKKTLTLKKATQQLMRRFGALRSFGIITTSTIVISSIALSSMSILVNDLPRGAVEKSSRVPSAYRDDAGRTFWEASFVEKKEMWGEKAALSTNLALELLTAKWGGVFNDKRILVPGAGYGRNAKVFVEAGATVGALRFRVRRLIWRAQIMVPCWWNRHQPLSSIPHSLSFFTMPPRQKCDLCFPPAARLCFSLMQSFVMPLSTSSTRLTASG